MTVHATNNIYTPGCPRHLRITDTMVCDFVVDPVLGCKVIFNAEMDYFQRVRLRTYHFVPEVIDQSGLSTAKSTTFFLWLNFRAVVFGDQRCAAYYQNYTAGVMQFFNRYRERRWQTPLFMAQVGRIDEQGEDAKASVKGSSCSTVYFRNESEVNVPAPDWGRDATGQAGLRFNAGGVDEWPKIEGGGSTGIRDQIKGRFSRECFNQYNMFRRNHIKYIATAVPMNHPADARVKAFQRQIEQGNPNYSIISFNFKDYSNLGCAA